VTAETAPQSSASVVIPAHALERSAGLAQTVASAFSQQPRPQEVIVTVDNNLDLYKWVCRELPDVIPVHNQGTRGASATRNAGASMAGGSVLAFLDDDVVATPGWLRCLTAPLARPGVAGVGGHVEPTWFGPTPGWMPEEFLWVLGVSYRGLPKIAAPVRNVWAGNMAVARDDFWAVGGFREGFGKLGGDVFRPEDTEFCIRLSTALEDRTWWYEPSARIRHNVPAERTTLRYFLRRCYHEGKGKAEMAAMLGLDGLRDERRHASRTLPRGFCRELRQAVLRQELSAAQRASAICAGLTATSLGYLVRRTRPQAAQRTVPAR
jgi:glycosyltransferase involved in cell wall biosynthesis